MGALLLILQLIGAIPQIIAAVKYIINLIKGIRNPVVKKQYRRELRKTVFKRRHVAQMSMAENTELHDELDKLKKSVLIELAKQEKIV